METALGERGRYSVPFGKSDVAAVHGEFLMVGDNGVSAIRWFDLTGRVRRVVRWDSEPVTVASRDRQDYADYYGRESPRFAPPSDAVYASARPRFSSLVSDRRGWMWVRMFAGRWEPPAPWLVFDSHGVLQCEVEAPGPITVLEIGDGYLLGRLRDEAGGEMVVLYAVVRTPHG